ncbi:uncharacterized protein LOC127851497 [Dreissena polymorpha]|nr:uncharacterized protein LOC127851497 [Dreissena polymorpha]
MIYNTNPEFCMSLIYPGGRYLKFKCELQADDNSITAKRLRMYHFLENVLSTNSVNIRLRFPSKGHFVLNVFATEENNGWRNVLTTRIINEAEDTQEAYPENPRDEWGPGVDAMKMGFVPKSHHSGEICVQTGVIQIVFRCETSIHLSHSLLRCDTRIDRNSFKVSVLRDKNNDVILIVDIDTKSQGIFILQLLARKSKNEQISNICNYLIRKEKPQCVPKLEFVTNNKISEKTNITAPESGCLQMTVEAHGMVEMVVELKLQDIQELNFSEHSRHWIRDNRCFIDLNFPRRGTYTLLVRGKELYDGRMRHIQQETIIVDVPSKRWSCFPKVGVHWNSFYRIDSPLTHNLKEKEDVTFLVEVFYAQDVAVLAANGWYHLDRLGESWLWKGHVWTGPKSTRSQLLARFEVGSPKWSELLLFKILAEHDFERLEERQENARALASNIKKLSN